MLTHIISTIIEWEFRRFHSAGLHIGKAIFPRVWAIHNRLPRPFVVTHETLWELAKDEASRYAPTGTVRHDGLAIGIADAIESESRLAIAHEIDRSHGAN